MPALVATFLQNRLTLRVDADIEQPSSEWIDGDAPEVMNAWDAYFKAAREHAQIPAEEWKRALDEAVHVVVGYLVKPTATLTQFVFRDKPGPLQIEIVQRRMAFFDAYPYLRDIVEGYFERKEVDSITQRQFQELVERVDRKMVEHYGPDEWAKLLRPLFEISVLIPETAGRPAIPSGILRVFFEEKRRGEIARRLAREEGRGMELVDETNLRRIIEEISLAASPPREEWELERDSGRPSPRREETAESPEEPAPRPQHRAPSLPPSDEPVPLWKKFAEQRSQAPKQPVPPPAPIRFEPSGDGDTNEETPLWAGIRSADTRAQSPPAEKPASAHFRQAETSASPPRSTDQKQPLWMRFAKTEPPTARVEKSVETGTGVLARLEESVLGPVPEDRRSWYVDHLFQGSPENYEAVLRQLNTAPSWAAASKIIGREVFQKNQVNIYSEPAVAFTDAVEARFSQPVRK